MKEIFPSRTKQKKWYKYKRNVQVGGDVVLRSNEITAGQSHRYTTRVVKVHTGTYGMVQSANVEYKLPGEFKFRTTTRPIHKLILIVLVEEQTFNKEIGGAEDDNKGEELSTSGSQQTRRQN